VGWGDEQEEVDGRRPNHARKTAPGHVT